MWPKVLLIFAAILLMGQSCQFPNLFGLGPSQPKNDGGVYRSDNHGQTWRQKSAGATGDSRGLRSASVRTLVFDQRNPDRLEVGTVEHGLWMTTNAGETWTPSAITTGEVPCIAMKASDPDVQYIAYGTTVRKSLDGGKTWRVVYTDGQGQGVTCVVTDRQTVATVWAMTSAGKILRSDDDGKTWAIALTTRAFQPRKVLQDDAQPDHLVIFTKSVGIIDIDIANTSWQNLNGGLAKYPRASIINGVSVLFGSPTVWTIATGYGLLQSFDRGSSWTVIPTLVTPGGAAIQNVVINSVDPKEMFITVGNKLHQTRDAGATWTIMSIPTSRLPVTLLIDPIRVDRMYVGSFFLPTQ